MMRRAAFALLAALLIGSAHAQPPRAFTAGSMADIKARHDAAPFVLAFWSLSCAYCPDELASLGTLVRRHGPARIVLVSTDTPEDRAAIASTLRRHALGDVESWVFADPFVERLRHAVDPRWHGELPRTYFMRGGQIVRAVSGVADAGEIETWISRQAAR